MIYETTFWRDRFLAFVLIAGVEIISELLLPFVPRDDCYYAGCASFNLFTYSFLLRRFRNTRLKRDLLLLTLTQITIQFLGWILYSAYMRPTIYNWAIHAIVFITFLRIFIVGNHVRTLIAAPSRSLFRSAPFMVREQISRIQR